MIEGGARRSIRARGRAAIEWLKGPINELHVRSSIEYYNSLIESLVIETNFRDEPEKRRLAEQNTHTRARSWFDSAAPRSIFKGTPLENADVFEYATGRQVTASHYNPNARDHIVLRMAQFTEWVNTQQELGSKHTA